MYSTHEAELDLPSLPIAARRVHIVPALRTTSLLSMAQLCDAGCTVTFDATSVSVRRNNQTILTGVRTPDTGLWHMSLLQSPLSPHVDTESPATTPERDDVHYSHSAVHSATPEALVAFAHAALFSPALSTLKQAIDNGFLPNFLGLTATGLRKYPPLSVAMIKGHLDQSRKNQRSTKPVSPPPELEPTASDTDDAFPASDPDNARTHQCFAAVFEPASGQIHSDQTGKFIVASSSGNNYVLIVYDYDSNSILVEPIRSRSGPCILAAFKIIHARLVTAGLRPQLHRLDNECSSALKTFLRDAEIDYQLVPPRLHRRNAAERAIRTFKNHFIAGLCSVDKNFPLHLWDKLLPQAELTLNLLRGSRLNPKLSAHAQMNGHFDCNRTPLAPPGIRVLVHIKPSERTTWSPYGADGWYTGPALESYGCYTVWLWDTRATRICDTLTWFPTKTTMPLASSNDLILAGVQDIIHALQHPSPGSPLAPLTDSHHNTLVQLTKILTAVASDTRDPEPTPPPAATPPTALPTTVVQLPHSPDASLRVDDVPVTTVVPTPVSALPDPTRLRVPPPVLSVKAVTFAPVPAPPGATFANSTGAIGKQRRRNHRRQRQQNTTVAPPPAKTVHPRKLNAAHTSPRIVASHHHGTRSKHLQHVAACGRTSIAPQ
ncbi:hypothetical protein MHU86_20271 [Fragilaria crotonensis]|nr:hypothetical protein MHU86_20271 [Fragilaria crotonensis]